MIDISIIILHYNEIEVTRNYINNLKSLNWENIEHHFIIVDNFSPDKSGVILKKIYEEDPKITVLLSRENLGFARGNNLGIKYASEHFNSTLFIVSNNDIAIEDTDFMQKLILIYHQESFAVLGPDIYSTRRNLHQSPMRETYFTQAELYTKIKTIEKQLFILKIIDKLKIYNLISCCKKLFLKLSSPKNSLYYTKTQEGVVLQGAFFVLSSTYLAQYPFGLYPKTFLYMEEDILTYLTLRKGLKLIYTPQLSVKHFEGISSLKKEGSKCKKYIFELTETQKSCVKMLELLKTDYTF